jgi:hypothetical protein
MQRSSAALDSAIWVMLACQMVEEGGGCPKTPDRIQRPPDGSTNHVRLREAPPGTGDSVGLAELAMRLLESFRRMQEARATSPSEALVLQSRPRPTSSRPREWFGCCWRVIFASIRC